MRCFGGGKGRGRVSTGLVESEVAELQDADTSVELDRLQKKAIQEFSYQELSKATGDFDDNLLIGSGGFGKVYKAIFEGSEGGSEVVAIKKNDPKKHQGRKQFVAEIAMLAETNHPNIIRLLGYCLDNEHMILVYEYMRLGTLAGHLYDDQNPLSWRDRMSIACDVVVGLFHLHCGMPVPVVHRDLNPNNILLGEGYRAKLTDFGLAIEIPNESVSKLPVGTVPYIAPEYAMQCYLTLKADIYSIGLILLEMITGRQSTGKTREGKKDSLVDRVYNLDKSKDDRSNFDKLVKEDLRNVFPFEEWKVVFGIAAMCIDNDVNKRPTVADLYDVVNSALQRVNVQAGSSDGASTSRTVSN